MIPLLYSPANRRIIASVDCGKVFHPLTAAVLVMYGLFAAARRKRGLASG
jgi:hypothetical protein